MNRREVVDALERNSCQLAAALDMWIDRSELDSEQNVLPESLGAPCRIGRVSFTPIGHYFGRRLNYGPSTSNSIRREDGKQGAAVSFAHAASAQR